jgi:N-acetylglucosaminyl-diphospho-decaprenol L-rhamnosyltransferase
VNDLAIIIVSTNEAHWLRPCLASVFEHAGEIDLDVVVVDNSSTDGTPVLVEQDFPRARVVWSENHGFSHANNRALMTCDARYVLFLNPDTEIADGTFGSLVGALDERPAVGAAGVRQLTGDGRLYPTIRRFPTMLRVLANAFGAERWPLLGDRVGQRVLDERAYDREVDCDWTSGSFLLVRREAVESAGFLDERFFIYAEETDLCYRIKNAGWEIRHLPLMTIIHHAGKGGVSPKMEAQNAFAMRQYASKHFSFLYRVAFLGALALRYTLRALLGGFDRPRRAEHRRAARRSLAVLVGLEAPPFGSPPRQAVTRRATDETRVSR